MWHRDVVVVTFAQLPSAEPEFILCLSPNPVWGMPLVCGGEHL